MIYLLIYQIFSDRLEKLALVAFLMARLKKERLTECIGLALGIKILAGTRSRQHRTECQESGNRQHCSAYNKVLAWMLL